VAADADFNLGQYPRVLEWIERIKGQPRYLPMNA
jgi:hypothetical protein